MTTAPQQSILQPVQTYQHCELMIQIKICLWLNPRKAWLQSSRSRLGFFFPPYQKMARLKSSPSSCKTLVISHAQAFHWDYHWPGERLARPWAVPRKNTWHDWKSRGRPEHPSKLECTDTGGLSASPSCLARKEAHVTCDEDLITGVKGQIRLSQFTEKDKRGKTNLSATEAVFFFFFFFIHLQSKRISAALLHFNLPLALTFCS